MAAVGTFGTCPPTLKTSAHGGRPEASGARSERRVLTLQWTLSHEETLSRVNDIRMLRLETGSTSQSGRSHFCRLSDRLRTARRCGGEKLTPCERHKIDFTDTL